MVKRRAKAAGISQVVTNHSFRGSGITIYLQSGGTIENARNIAAHASTKTTQMYDRRGEAITLDEINRIHL
jgi:integrase